MVRVSACHLKGPGSIPIRCTTCMMCRVGQVTGGLLYLLENLEFLFLTWDLFGGTWNWRPQNSLSPKRWKILKWSSNNLLHGSFNAISRTEIRQSCVIYIIDSSEFRPKRNWKGEIWIFPFPSTSFLFNQRNCSSCDEFSPIFVSLQFRTQISVQF